MSKQGMSIRKYAEHRGVSHTAVIKAIEDKRITTLSDGSIDAEIADKQWSENTNPAYQQNAPGGIKAIQEIKLKNEAALLHFKVQRESGKYIPKTDSRNIVLWVFSDLRDALLLRCQRISTSLVNINDSKKISRLLEEDTKRIMEEYRNEFRERYEELDGRTQMEEGNSE